MGQKDSKQSNQLSLPEEKHTSNFLTLFKGGDESAFRQVVESYGERLYHSALKILKNSDDAEDVVAESFAIAFNHKEQFNGKSSVYTWLWRICFNLCYHRIAEKKGESIFTFSEIFENDDGEESVRESFLSLGEDLSKDYIANQRSRIIRRIVRRAVLQLNKDFRRVIILREYYDYSYEEIAVMLGISTGTVMSRLWRARTLLKKIILCDKDFMNLKDFSIGGVEKPDNQINWGKPLFEKILSDKPASGALSSDGK